MNRGGFGRGGRGGDRGFRGGGRGGGRGGFQRRDEGPPETVLELGSFVHAVEDEMLCSSLMPDKVPHFNAPIYLQNKSQIGKVDEILGPVNEVYFSIKMEPGMVAASFKKGDKVYVSDQKLLPIERFLPKPKIVGGKGKHIPFPPFLTLRLTPTIAFQSKSEEEEEQGEAGGELREADVVAFRLEDEGSLAGEEVCVGAGGALAEEASLEAEGGAVEDADVVIKCKNPTRELYGSEARVAVLYWLDFLFLMQELSL